MKKIFTIIIFLFTFWSQAQNGITYQAVILNPNTEELPGVDNSRLPLVNQNVTLEFKILNVNSLLDYQETINTQTDEFGMVNVVIGTGTRKAGIATQFSGINWDGSAKTLIVSLDPSGKASHFIEISNQPFTYVPFALYAVHTGVAGTQGPAGNNGLDGKTVLNGTTNPIASLGTNGDFYINTVSSSLFGPKTNEIWGSGVPLVGPQGIQGPIGLTGATGPQGIQGVAGPTGATGPQGTAGTNGANGTNGNNGLSAYQIWLNAGNIGTEAQFLTSLRGATGVQGPQGIQGPIGLTGAIGPQGVAGTNGTNGTNGLSAYQIWLNDGNTGTEAQFLAALRGATGAQGIPGATGTQGIAGTNGTNGLDGKTVLNGTQNPTASTGNNGDFYINTTTNSLFGPKTSGDWGSGIALVGPQGATGTNGKNSLINTTIEAAGANCASGGTKIEAGIDANSNGILDSGEVNSSLTKYVCNGGSSSSSSHGVWAWTNGSSFIVPVGVSTLMIEFQGVSGGSGANANIINGVYTYPAIGGSGGGSVNTKLLLINLNPGDLLSINNSVPGINSSLTSSCSVCGTGCNVVCSAGNGGNGEITNLTLNGNIISSISGGNGGEGGKINLALYGGNGTHNGAIGNYGVISLHVNHIALLSQTQIASSLSPKLVINY